MDSVRGFYLYFSPDDRWYMRRVALLEGVDIPADNTGDTNLRKWLEEWVRVEIRLKLKELTQ